ncbi:MAG: glycosyltransferase family 4 protein [Syntrophaceae bacterium]|nr:glycosyltransferase family 4 protein [Syntrophaceae bacterium]
MKPKLITILHTESSLGWGGQERRTLRELLGLSKDAFRPILACQPESRIGQEAREKKIQVEMVKMRGNFDPLAVARFVWMIHHHSVDVVHTHSSADSWMASTAAKISPGRPKVVRTRHLNAPFNVRLIYSFMADRVVTVGGSTRQYMIREKGIPAEKVMTIPTGIDLSLFDPERTPGDLRRDFEIPAQAPVFGTVSVFRKLKGHQFLLEATPEIIRAIPEARLLLAGEGPQEKNIREKIEKLRLEKAVILAGCREDVPRVLNTLDVFVFPSLQEALGTAVLEALAMRRAVVASRVGGIPEIIEDGKTGFLVEPENFSGVAEKVIHLLKNPELRRLMGDRGRQFVEARYDQRLMVRRLEDLYRELTEEQRS